MIALSSSIFSEFSYWNYIFGGTTGPNKIAPAETKWYTILKKKDKLPFIGRTHTQIHLQRFAWSVFPTGSLTYLNTWSTVSCSVWGSCRIFRRQRLAKISKYRGWALIVYSLALTYFLFSFSASCMCLRSDRLDSCSYCLPPTKLESYHLEP